MKQLPLFLALILAFAPAAPVAAQVINSAANIPGSAPSVPALRFDLSRPEMRQAYRDASATLEGALAGIVAAPAPQANFANTVLAQEKAVGDYTRAMVPLVFAAHVSPDKGVRMTAQAIEKVMNRRFVELGQREDIFKRVEAAAAKGEALDAADQKLLDKTLRDYRDSGLGLAPEQRARLKAVQTKLNDLSARFEININESKDFLEVDDAGLEGLPADYKASLDKTPEGKYKVGLDYPSYVPFMRYAKNGELRKALNHKYENRAMPENLPILKEGLELRRELALLLGYKDYPTMALKDRMAKTPERVAQFLARLTEKVRERAKSELAAVLEVKRRDDPSATELGDHERGYYSRILREEKYSYDAEEVRQYFPVDRVVSGVMNVYQRILGVTFREVKGGPVWHPDVRLFEIVDTKTGKLIGHFYLDLYPREGKYTHAAAFPLLMGRAIPGGYDQTAAAMVANFPKAIPGKPALLPHSEVETFFHEFGHLMHQTLTQARHMSFSGTSVALDFVEAPSQMLENFAWEPEVIAEISGRWDTGEKLPAELLKKMTAARRFNEGVQTLQQIAMAAADMALHSLVPADPSAEFNRVVAEITGMPQAPGGNTAASFGHLMGGYGAGYYSYLWSLVFAEDIFSAFKAEGPLNPVVGARYRKEILETGSERTEAESLKAFLGREPNEDAFMKSLEDEKPEAPALAEARKRVGALPKGVTIEFREHFDPNNPQVYMEIDRRPVYWEYLYHSESNLARLRRRWWNPLTWFAGVGRPSDDIGARYEAALRFGVEARAAYDKRAASR
ncbi:MAG: Zn-dependent oligopeptidase [Elusimicrobia bacterium]|nr:Zn-dependent oligopeptidase [Elusimicrobiota bacterium]